MWNPMSKTRSLSAVVVGSLALLMVAPLGAADRNEERQALLGYLEETRQMVRDAVVDLSAEQWHFKPGEDRWSIAEVVEHLALTEDLLRGVVEGALAEETPAEMLAEAGGKGDQVLAVILDRSQSFQAPEPVRPDKKWDDPSAALAHLEAARDETLALAREAALWNHAADHPAVGPLDLHGWLLFLSGHCQRHVAQIEEVKAEEGYPEG